MRALVSVFLCIGCGVTAPAPRTVVPVDRSTERGLAEAHEASPAKTDVTPFGSAPAEPYSAAWLDESEPEFDQDMPRHAWVDAHACAQPDEASGDPPSGYEELLEALFDFGKGVRPLATMRALPDFGRAPRVLGLLSTAQGGFVLRSIEIAYGKWYELVTRSRDGHVTLEEAIAEVAAARAVREHSIDRGTARLMIEVWRALNTRAEVVEEVNPWLFTLHPTTFIWETGGTRSFGLSPTRGSVLGEVVAATDHFQRVLNGTSTDKVAELQVARDRMRDALERTRRKEPCLLHFDLPLKPEDSRRL